MPITRSREPAPHRNELPGVRWLLTLAAAAGVVRTAEEALDESGARTEPIDPSTRSEGSDLNVKAVFITGVGLLLGIWAVVVGIYPIFAFFKFDRTGGLPPAKVLTYLPKLPPEPRLQELPKADLADFEASQMAALHSYRWVDRARGIVSIPIDRAMEIVARRGIPPSAPGGNQYYNPEAGSRRTGFEGKVEPIPQ